ncbi:hypothetical protein [Gemmatimonas sp.]|uniref:hypothetical protein n=1 Tax=Gemmatimonas sp. TaxID=1962908 RepID=UPI00333F1EC4
MTLDLIHAELIRIREALEARPFASGAPAAKPAPSFPKSDEVPMPTEVIANAGEVQVHFGKNKGVALSSLSERSVAWYAQEPEPRLGNNGKPFPPRPEDVLLRNAARTIIHQKRGTLPSAAVTQPNAPVAAIDDGDVSF